MRCKWFILHVTICLLDKTKESSAVKGVPAPVSMSANQNSLFIKQMNESYILTRVEDLKNKTEKMNKKFL